MELSRRYGLLLHPTSLPGPWGIGTLGPEARQFVDWLQAAGASWWQVLPLGPTGYGNSPYQTVSSFAGNPLLIDLEALFQRGWLTEREPLPFPTERVDYGWVDQHRWPLLRRAWSVFCEREGGRLHPGLVDFRRRQSYWIEDYALYRALKSAHDQKDWVRWPPQFKQRQPEALAAARQRLAADIDFHAWTQWLFYEQWSALRAYAAERGVRIIGDIPIFVSRDAPEVWAHPELFHLDAQGRPEVVAGVPPDYFSATGQLWGNPLYDWPQHRAQGFAWWVERLRTVLETCDLVRIDHFRGFQAYWEVPADADTAVAGRWVEAPGRALFATVREQLGDIPVIAEDLGVITPEVERLRDDLGLPGMKVLQFAFDGDADNAFLPHHHPAHGRYLVYPGTHDNDTSLGWYRKLERKRRAEVRDYLLSYDLPLEPDTVVPWSLLQLAFKSPGRLAVACLQDALGLDSWARMNTPAVAEGNWTWRCAPEALTEALAAQLRAAAAAEERLADQGPAPGA